MAKRISGPTVQKSRIGLRKFAGIALAALIAAPAYGQGPAVPLPGADGKHSHKPVRVNLRPIVTRTTTPLSRPRRVILDSRKRVILSDWAAGTVLRIANGRTETLADELSEPSGLVLDGQGNLYVAQHALGTEGAGSVLRISPMGERLLVADGLTGPTALAFDSQGNLLIACFHDNTIRSVSVSAASLMMDEEPKIVANVPSPTGIAVDARGNVWVSSSRRGSIYKLTSGTPKLIARGLSEPSDIVFDSKGHLVVACSAGSRLAWVSPKGQIKTYARVPKGTVGVCFAEHDNLWLVNWDFRTLIKITSTLEVPCPHCGKPIPLHLRPKKKAAPATGNPDV